MRLVLDPNNTHLISDDQLHEQEIPIMHSTETTASVNSLIWKHASHLREQPTQPLIINKFIMYHTLTWPGAGVC